MKRAALFIILFATISYGQTLIVRDKRTDDSTNRTTETSMGLGAREAQVPQRLTCSHDSCRWYANELVQQERDSRYHMAGNAERRLRALEADNGRERAVFATLGGTVQTSNRPQGYGVGFSYVQSLYDWRGFVEIEIGGSNTRGALQGGIQLACGLQYQFEEGWFIGGGARFMVHKDSLSFKPIWQGGLAVNLTRTLDDWFITATAQPMFLWSFENEVLSYGTRGVSAGFAITFGYKIGLPL